MTQTIDHYPVLPSKNRLKKAGDVLRYSKSGRPVSDADVAAAYRVLASWRKCHIHPLHTTAAGLRSAVRTITRLTPNQRVASRIKREPSIVRKLVTDRTRLYTMADIAGCRAVLNNLDEVYAIAERLGGPRTRLTMDKVLDYNVRPPASGYRALHLHVRRNSHLVEVQLRTNRQHDWAMRVERYDIDTDSDAKHGAADREALSLLRDLSAEFATLDQRERVQPPLPLEE